jgi:hypothetical protein
VLGATFGVVRAFVVMLAITTAVMLNLACTIAGMAGVSRRGVAEWRVAGHQAGLAVADRRAPSAVSRPGFPHV